MSLGTLQCTGESLDIHLPMESWPLPTSVPTTRSQSVHGFSCNPLSLFLLGRERLSHLDESWKSVMSPELFMMPPFFMPALWAFYVSVVPWPCLSDYGLIFLINTWSESVDTTASGSHLLERHPLRLQSDWAGLCQASESLFPSSHWRPNLNLIPAPAVTISVTLSQLLHAPLGRHFLVLLGREVSLL